MTIAVKSVFFVWAFMLGTASQAAAAALPQDAQLQLQEEENVPDSVKGGAAAMPEPPVPELPVAPVLTNEVYPECREDYQKLDAPYDKADDVNRCTRLIDQYYEQVLLPFRAEMIAHQEEIARIYTQQVGGNGRYYQSTQDKFYADMMKEHAASDTQGEHLADYRVAVDRYEADRAYLQDRFCFNTGCNGYAKPKYTAPEPEVELADGGDTNEKTSKKSKKKEKRTTEQQCKRARKRGQGIGGFLGGIVGSAAGLDGIGSILASVGSGILVGEIACQLTEEEQEVAAEATIEVTEKEEVGATATWQSPTRSGVSGSSTVTALNTRPNGSKCLTITDIAIIDGEETRIEKQMCRGQGDEGYVIRA